MPDLTQHQSTTTTKLLLIGDSGTGKTGALAALAAAGFELFIADFDNGLDVLKDYLTNPKSIYVKQSPDCAKRVHYHTLTDPMKSTNGVITAAKSVAWDRLGKLLNDWRDEDKSFGNVASWDDNKILVIDSLTMASASALNFHLAMNGLLGTKRTQNEARRDVWAAQTLIKRLIEMLYDSAVKANIIVTAHVKYVNDPDKPKPSDDNQISVARQGYPSAIGSALSLELTRYFNSALQTKTIGTGTATRHKIYTVSQGIVNLKSSAPLKVLPEYSLETGLAEYFKAIRS